MAKRIILTPAAIAAGIRRDDPRLSLKGVRLHGAGWQAYRSVNGRVRYSDTLPIETSASALLDAHAAIKASAPVPVAGSLAALMDEYLTRVTAQTGYKEKVRHAGLWITELGGTRGPRTVTDTEIDQVIQKWKSTPVVYDNKTPGAARGRSAPHGLGAATIRKRLAVLTRFYNVMLPKHKNPVELCSERPPEPDPEARGVPMDVIARILDAMRDTGPDRRSPSLAKIRARVTATTGLDPAQIMTLQPKDLMLVGADPWFKIGRKKGAGVEVRKVYLVEAGRAALLTFVAANAWGKYGVQGVNKSVKCAAAKVGVVLGSFRQKDLRHSFLTELFRLCKDEATVARFALHCEGSRMTARYTLAAHDEVNRAAAAAFVMPTVTPTPTAAPMPKPRRRAPLKIVARAARERRAS